MLRNVNKPNMESSFFFPWSPKSGSILHSGQSEERKPVGAGPDRIKSGSKIVIYSVASLRGDFQVKHRFSGWTKLKKFFFKKLSDHLSTWLTAETKQRIKWRHGSKIEALRFGRGSGGWEVVWCRRAERCSVVAGSQMFSRVVVIARQRQSTFNALTVPSLHSALFCVHS